ncbi:hypothetical protein FRACYDRAFT_250986 [Fragilariopsis cylindrus CCMP1102]|uniref:Uncharacterized protein n=1 Tax=Fragilariopsis cylindrus CCMP1102 TaxID=635003 RepID=A0A1E7EPU8_9STRA|nr:hypothetical protein FRACYDRAFT_250986 [Fragilariopsis cylindrus CCMP1102]|eukprot:OEU07563.1 hypothetical protein FRACYDRAFT_250986 [Fragilariopsis cylindrus CCMP1102]
MIATTTATVTVLAIIIVSSSIRGSIVVVDAFSSQQIIITPTKPTTRSILAGRRNTNGNRSMLPLIFDDDWRTTTHGCTASSSSPFSSTSTIRTRMMTTTSLNLSTDDDDDEIENSNLISSINTIFGKFFSFSSLMALWLPLFAIWGIPALVDHARSFPPNSPQQFQAVTILIVSNRIYLYSLAVTIVGLAAIRGSKFDPPSLGQRLTSVTEELLVFDRPLQVVLDNNNKEGEEEEEVVIEGDESVQEASKTLLSPPSLPSPSYIQKMVDDSGLEENLDNVNTETQAILLPVLVSGLLAASVLSLPIWEDGINLFGSASSTTTDNNELFLQLKKAIADIIPVVSQGWNALLLALFTRAEIRRIGYELFGLEITNIDEAIDGDLEKSRNTVQIILEIVIAISITGYGAYYLQYWPACNFVNMSIAILVARAIQLNTFQSIVGALTLLTIYDGASVFLIPAANAFVDSSSSSSSIVGVDSSLLLSSTSSSSNTLIADASASASAMGSVAIQKLTSTSFQPGLLVAKLDGDKITGALGLGDAVFPSILATFLKRFDNEQQTLSTSKSTSTSLSLFVVSLVGYIIGCMLCEFAPTISTGGLPALVFILPSMLISVTGGAIVSNQFDNLWNYNSSSSDPTTTGSSNK